MSAELKIVNEEKREEVTKEQHAINYLKSMISIEKAMEPYKEQKKNLRKNYMENGWLTRQDIWNAVKAFRFYQQDADMDDLNDMFEIVEQQFGEKE